MPFESQPKDAELFVGIVARIGVDTRMVSAEIAKSLQSFGYASAEIRITNALRSLDGYSELPEKPLDMQLTALIEACNKLRKDTGHIDIMARIAVAEVVNERADFKSAEKDTPRRAYIISQLKRKEESAFLRELYGEQYVQISCHSDTRDRVKRLATAISHDHPDDPKPSSWISEAERLVRDDEAQESIAGGQQLREVFPTSDVFVDASRKSLASDQLDRFFRALFGDARVTPSRDEHGMQLARSASLRSSDLSRQVGAAIFNKLGEIQALGCNEVPRAGGGTYWEGDADDARDFQLGKDSNDERKAEMLTDMAVRFMKIGLIDPKFQDIEAVRSEIFNRADKEITDAQFMNSLEYGRSIHAEMNAITDAARGGHSLRNSILYCNTFPCHNCAKHIVASGITNVVYLKPYPKSYAQELFDDSITVDSGNAASDKVQFNPFIGICGPMYERVFYKGKWKLGDGSVPDFKRKAASFTRTTPAPNYGIVEAIFGEDLEKILEPAGQILNRPLGSATYEATLFCPNCGAPQSTNATARLPTAARGPKGTSSRAKRCGSTPGSWTARSDHERVSNRVMDGAFGSRTRKRYP